MTTVPGELTGVTWRFVQLFRSPTKPADFPASIVSGLSSSDAVVQRAAIIELRAYLKHLFFLPFEKYFYISNLVPAGIICLIIVIGVPVILHRLYHGRLYPFRVEKRAQGSYLVPNAINCFLLLEGVYGVIFVAFSFVVWQLYANKTGQYVKIFQAARSMLWIPLHIGAFLTGWGSFYTAPGALDKPTATRNKTSAKGHLRWPVIVNLSCWGVPVVLIISLLPTVCLSSVTMNRTFDDWINWDHRFETLLAFTVVNTLVVQTAVNNFRSEANVIFVNWTRSYYYIDIGYVLWGFWALLFLVFYVPAGGVLVCLLYRQVVRQRGILLSYQGKVEAQFAQQELQTQVSFLYSETRTEPASRPVVGRSTTGQPHPVWSTAHPTTDLGAPLDDIYEDCDSTDDSQGTGQSGATASMKSAQEFLGFVSALRQDGPASSQVQRANTQSVAPYNGQAIAAASRSDDADHAEQAQGDPPTIMPTMPRPPSAFRRLMRLDKGTSSNRGGQDSMSMARRRRIPITGDPMARYRYLRRCLINLLILYFGIIAAACFFGAVTIYLAAVEYEHALRGPYALVVPIGVAGSTAAWVSAVFGVITVGSIIFRNFDNPQPEASQYSGEGGNAAGGIRRRFNRNASRTTASGSGGEKQNTSTGEHEKTRTLPAAPESVDLEASMMSMVQSRPRMTMNAQMRFAIADQISCPGGFIIRLDDQLASNVSVGFTPEAKEPRRHQHESFGRASTRRWV